MLPAALASETVTRLRGTTSQNTHGNDVTSWASPGSLEIDGCSVQPVQGSEDLLTRDSVTSRWQWFGPLGSDVKSSDRIRHRGIDYEVDGSVQEWIDPTGSGLDHMVCYLKRIEG
jgi:hypothetical protein